jgi:hypothetical protein
MSKDDSNDLKYYHDKGEQDRAEGNTYTPPNGFLGGLINMQYEDDAYETGWDNADKQAHGD